MWDVIRLICIATMNRAVLIGKKGLQQPTVVSLHTTGRKHIDKLEWRDGTELKVCGCVQNVKDIYNQPRCKMVPRRKVFQFNAQREWVYPKVLTCKYCRREIITDPRDPDKEPYYQRGTLSVDFAYHMRCHNMRGKR